MFKNIFIATFSLYENGKRTPINGMVEPLLSYFLPKTENVDLLDGFHPGSNDVITIVEKYKDGKKYYQSQTVSSIILSPLLRLQNNNATQVLFKIRDIFSTIEFGITSRKKYDLFIGLESIYTLCGTFLKKLGIVKKVVYYVSDYSPNRYPQKWFNDIYLKLDRFCCYNADVIWDVSPAIQKARIEAGLVKGKCKPVILVPNALFVSQISHKPFEKIIPYSLVYAGTLTKSNGPDLLINAIPNILKKFPKTSLHIFGSNGEDQKRIQDLIKKNELSKQIVFHGFIKDVADITRAINSYQIGIAPYIDTPGSHRKFGDATKLRLYMGAGLPIIVTHVPPLGKVVSDFGAAIQIKDNEKEIAKAVIKLFEDKNLYKSMREKAIEYAKNNTWKNTYSLALKQMND